LNYRIKQENRALKKIVRTIANYPNKYQMKKRIAFRELVSFYFLLGGLQS